MLGWLLTLFIVVPVVELSLLIKVGALIHVGPTIAIILTTGLAGAALAKRQGLQTMARINAELAAGRMPATELGEGLLILLAGALLITPGFLTDLFGLGMLVPAFRRLFLKAVVRYFESKIIVPETHSVIVDNDEAADVIDADPFSSPGTAKHVENRAIDEP